MHHRTYFSENHRYCRFPVLENPKVAIAFSGGVDSAFLLYAAKRWGADAKAYYANSAFQPRFEQDDARRLADELGVELEILPADVLSCPDIAQNPANRCYFCKKTLFSAMMDAAQRDGVPVLLDGTNASDDAADRPGMQALRELQVRSPLREAGLTKAEIRRLSKEAGLFTHDKPAYACLATRIPTGEPITKEKLAATEAAEGYLAKLGFRDFRVRCPGGIARLQLREEDLPLLLRHRQKILDTLKQHYSGVTLDLEVRR